MQFFGCKKLWYSDIKNRLIVWQPCLFVYFYWRLSCYWMRCYAVAINIVFWMLATITPITTNLLTIKQSNSDWVNWKLTHNCMIQRLLLITFCFGKLMYAHCWITEEVGHIITRTALRQSCNTWPLQPSSTSWVSRS